MDRKTRIILAIFAQHLHESNFHQYDGTNAAGEPVLGVSKIADCISEPCVEINHQLKVMHVG